MSLEAHHRFILDTMQRNQDIARNIINELEAENASLKAEVERLRASSFVTAVPSEHYERVIKAGDAMAFNYEQMHNIDGVYDSDLMKFVARWNAAKEGNQS